MGDAIRVRHYARNTEQAYVYWTQKSILFHNTLHHKEMGTGEVQAFLTHLALGEYISASTQNQTLSALLFLYRNVLSQALGPDDSVRVRHGHDLAIGGGIDKRAVAIGGETMQREVDRVMPLVEDGGYLPELDHTVPPDISWQKFGEYMQYLVHRLGRG